MGGTSLMQQHLSLSGGMQYPPFLYAKNLQYFWQRSLPGQYPPPVTQTDPAGVGV